MKAIVYDTYGGPEVLNMIDIQEPHPDKNQLLVKVVATTATAAEGMMRRGDSLMSRLVLGWFKPRKKYRVLGIEFSGLIQSVGEQVNTFAAGDEVYGFAGFTPGAYAEYICLPKKASVVKKPSNLNFQEAASIVDGASTAYFFLKDKANLQAGQKVLIIGASGSIGCYAVQLAKYFGAHVTGICSTKNTNLVHQQGADEVIDYTQVDYSKQNISYDIIFDTVGKSTFNNAKKVLTDRGIYLATNGSMLKNSYLTIKTRFGKGKRFIFGMSVNKTEALTFLKHIIEEGRLKPVIDQVYPMEEVQEAHRYVEGGHKVGNVVITI